MKVSVVICTKNSEKTIKRCLLSVKAQDHPIHEIIVVDGDSKDRTIDIVKKIGVDKIISDGGRGLGCARQLGAEAASGDIVCFIDSDTWSPSWWLREMVKHMESDEELVGIQDVYWSLGFNLTSKLEAYFFNVSTFKVITKGVGPATGIENSLWRKWLFEKVKFDPRFRLLEDLDFLYRVNSAGYKTIRTPYIYHVHFPRVSLKESYEQYKYRGYFTQLFLRKHALRERNLLAETLIAIPSALRNSLLSLFIERSIGSLPVFVTSIWKRTAFLSGYCLARLEAQDQSK